MRASGHAGPSSCVGGRLRCLASRALRRPRRFPSEPPDSAIRYPYPRRPGAAPGRRPGRLERDRHGPPDGPAVHTLRRPHACGTPRTGQEVAFSVQLLLLLTVLSLAPSILILITSFLRISIVLDFVKRALSLQQVPPNQVLMGISLFLTIFIMWPTFDDGLRRLHQAPRRTGKIGVEQAYTAAEKPFRLFMYNQMKDESREHPALHVHARPAQAEHPRRRARPTSSSRPSSSTSSRSPSR